MADREGLTPLWLLGRTSEGDLGRCRLMLPFLPSLLNATPAAPYLAGDGGGDCAWCPLLTADDVTLSGRTDTTETLATMTMPPK